MLVSLSGAYFYSTLAAAFCVGMHASATSTAICMSRDGCHIAHPASHAIVG
jgi:hypothetical protein